ncbi:hypothetical protein E3N88_46295 [Mikania micrantha]|uniref:Rx N-terminal domain-containing protein n=1 Tax=Mikania micrantha TaxID=192012 RepID=A0A5N6L6Y5_9ASTR|nr:hypothetical protein E3N88_46295 [Mikania micrantha]
MAEVVVSAVLPVLFEKLTSAALKSIARYNGINADIKKLHRSLTRIQDVLVDASRKEITSQSVKRWLNDLQHLAYDIDDVLDDLATDVMERELTRESEAICSKVRKLIPSCCTNFSKNSNMLDKLDSINKKLQDLLKEKTDLGLSVIEEPRPRNIENRRFQSSVVDESRIVGRQAEKEALVQQLLQADEPSHQSFEIVPVFGMGGVGKTTLARLLYNDQRVREHFELKGWVCISDEFDIFGRTKDIFKSVGGDLKKKHEDFNKLHEALRDHVNRKRILLPLALIAVGTSLRKKEDEDSWKGVLESEIWNLPVEGEILPALRLSYHDLSAPLKQVFAYCSLFPKDFLFDKDELTLLWMAEGFLHRSTQSHSTEEKLGHEYFDELLSRSFFQYAPDNELFFVMHDLMNDLATHVAGEFFVRLDIEAKDTKEEMLEKYHHMSFVSEEYVTYKKFEAFKRAKSLRTFLATSSSVVDMWKPFYLSNKILVDLLSELPLLRVLSLSKFEVSKVPDSIGSLRHLRYLNLSQTRIKDLPENISNLYNLETLILFGCPSLAKLPNSFLKLKNLRHLDIRETPCLDQLPLGIAELKSLQTLSRIIIGGGSGFKITKLKDLENLRGEVSIVGLEKVQNATDASVANFPQKRLSELEVVWSDAWDGSRNEILEKDVLNELKPRNDKLIELKIRSYGRLEFPKWVGDPLFVHLKHVSLSGCKRCTSLPPLAQLQSLKELFIQDLDGVEAVGMDLLGTCHAFPSLKVLSFKQMHGWEKWSTNNGEDLFPCLKRLVIEYCPNLVEVTLEATRSLNVLELTNCDCGVLRRLAELASSVIKLRIANISGLNDVVWRGVMYHLGAVEDLSINYCHNIRYLWEYEAVASKVLVNLRHLLVMKCDNLVSLGDNGFDEDNNLQIASLRSLDVSSCKNLERCSCPYSIENLSVSGCSSIKSISLPIGGVGRGLKSLYMWGCDKLLEREWGGQNNNNRKRLEKVAISDWSNLKSIINLNCLVHLTRLEIRHCKGLESLPDNELPNLTSLKLLRIVKCPRIDGCFPRGLWPPNLQTLEIGRLKKPISEWGSQNFPSSLVQLHLHGDGGEDGSGSQFSNLLPSSLTYLKLYDFRKLESFSIGLQHLQRLSFDKCLNLQKLSHPQHLNNSLQHFTFFDCPNMKDLPEQLLPKLLSLDFEYRCPNLTERYSKGGSYWPLISHIPRINPATCPKDDALMYYVVDKVNKYQEKTVEAKSRHRLGVSSSVPSLRINV